MTSAAIRQDTPKGIPSSATSLMSPPPIPPPVARETAAGEQTLTKSPKCTVYPDIPGKGMEKHSTSVWLKKGTTAGKRAGQHCVSCGACDHKVQIRQETAG